MPYTPYHWISSFGLFFDSLQSLKPTRVSLVTLCIPDPNVVQHIEKLFTESSDVCKSVSVSTNVPFETVGILQVNNTSHYIVFINAFPFCTNESWSTVMCSLFSLSTVIVHTHIIPDTLSRICKTFHEVHPHLSLLPTVSLVILQDDAHFFPSPTNFPVMSFFQNSFSLHCNESLISKSSGLPFFNQVIDLCTHFIRTDFFNFPFDFLLIPDYLLRLSQPMFSPYNELTCPLFNNCWYTPISSSSLRSSDVHSIHTPVDLHCFSCIITSALTHMIHNTPNDVIKGISSFSTVTSDLSLFDYVSRFVHFGFSSPSIFIVALILLDRLKRANFNDFKGFYLITDHNVQKLFLTAFSVASKMQDYPIRDNSFFASLGGVTRRHLAQLETEFLFAVKFSVHVSSNVFDKFAQRLFDHFFLSSCSLCSHVRLSQTPFSGSNSPIELSSYKEVEVKREEENEEENGVQSSSCSHVIIDSIELFSQNLEVVAVVTDVCKGLVYEVHNDDDGSLFLLSLSCCENSDESMLMFQLEEVMALSHVESTSKHVPAVLASESDGSFFYILIPNLGTPLFSINSSINCCDFDPNFELIRANNKVVVKSCQCSIIFKFNLSQRVAFISDLSRLFLDFQKFAPDCLQGLLPCNIFLDTNGTTLSSLSFTVLPFHTRPTVFPPKLSLFLCEDRLSGSNHRESCCVYLLAVLTIWILDVFNEPNFSDYYSILVKSLGPADARPSLQVLCRQLSSMKTCLIP
ncbi:hypothetical protein RCL1_006301 [Eukaryota sp. TZLM3-RCL]